jgi:hypothetical protein
MGNRFYALVGAVLLLIPASLAAQKNYRLENSGGRQHFVQVLSWYDDENAFRYEVVVEAGTGESDGRQEILREFTETNDLEVSLPAGQYRYRIRAYDFFDIPSDYSPWFPLEILQALRPEILELVFADAVKKKIPPGRQDSPPVYSISLAGKNLLPSSSLSLKDKKGKAFPLEYRAEEAEGGGLVILRAPLSPGNYSLTVENPGGLFTSLSFTVTRTAGGANRYVSVGYAPLLPLYGGLNELLNTTVYPAGAFARFDYAPLNVSSFSFGAGAAPSWNYIAAKYTQPQNEYDVSSQLLGGRVYLLGQKWFLDSTLALNLRLGGGAYLMLDMQKGTSGQSYDPINVLLPAISGEFSFLWAFKEPFFAEAGAAYLHFFSVDDPSPGFLQPFLGLGMRF